VSLPERNEEKSVVWRQSATPSTS